MIDVAKIRKNYNNAMAAVKKNAFKGVKTMD